MKKLVALLMAMMMVVSLTACGGGDGEGSSKKESKKSIVGTWEADVDFSDFLEEGIGEELGADAEYFDFSDFTIQVTMEFNKDKTYWMGITDEAAQDAVDQLLAVLEGGLVEYLEAELAGSGMSVEEALDLYGLSMDDFMDLLKEEMGGDEFVDELAESFEAEGDYKVEGNKLYMSEGFGEEFNEDVYEIFELKGDKLTLTESVGGDSAGDVFYPIKFKKAD